jgi:ADP-heptose:LPS heptosyltransferase
VERHIREPRRVLILCLDNLGDLVFASALAPPLRTHFPAAHLALWCKAYTKPVGMMFPAVNQVYAADPFWDRSPLRGKGKLVPYLRTLFAVRRDRYDTAIVVSSHWRVAATAVAAGLPVRIGREHRRNRRFLTDVLPPEDRTRLAVRDLGRLLGPLGIRDVPRNYRLDPGSLAERHRRLASRVGVERVAAVNPFAGSQDKCLPVTEWIRVATALPAVGLRPLWLGSARELATVRSAAGSTSPARWLFADEIGDDSIEDMTALITLSAIYLGHDSGPLHIASALGTPAVGVYRGIADPRRTGPHGIGASRVVDVRQDPGDAAERILAAAAALWR